MLNWTVDSIQYGLIKRLQRRKHDVFKDYKSQYSRRTRSSTQFQRFKCCSILSIYRPPFAGYVSKSCPISARSSPDSSTSPACKFSNVRFTFLWSAPGSTTTMKKKETEQGSGSYTHEDPGSGTMWSPRAPTQAMHSCASVMPLRFAMVVKGSTTLRLSLMFFEIAG